MFDPIDTFEILNDVGGIKANNVLRTVHGSVSRTGHALDGVAIASEIMASRDPRKAAITLSVIFNSFKASLPPTLSPKGPLSGRAIVEKVIELMSAVRDINPLIQQVFTGPPLRLSALS